MPKKGAACQTTAAASSEQAAARPSHPRALPSGRKMKYHSQQCTW